MKTFLYLFTGMLFAFIIQCNGQPNTESKIRVGIVSTQVDKSFLVFAEVKDDSNSTVLQSGMDYLSPNVSAYIKPIEDIYQSGDTTWGFITYQDQAFERFAVGGLVQVNDLNNKYSAMTRSYWIALDTIEGMNAGFIWVLD